MKDVLAETAKQGIPVIAYDRLIMDSPHVSYFVGFDSKEIGKPTGNDMVEGKLTLPVIYALNNSHLESMHTLARKVKAGTVNPDEIAVLVEFTKEQGGIEYAERRMEEIAAEARVFIDKYVKEKAVKEALTAYLEYVIQRNY